MDIEKMTVKQLKAELIQLGAPTTGLKAVLIERLKSLQPKEETDNMTKKVKTVKKDKEIISREKSQTEKSQKTGIKRKEIKFDTKGKSESEKTIAENVPDLYRSIKELVPKMPDMRNKEAVKRFPASSPSDDITMRWDLVLDEIKALSRGGVDAAEEEALFAAISDGNVDKFVDNELLLQRFFATYPALIWLSAQDGDSIYKLQTALGTIDDETLDNLSEEVLIGLMAYVRDENTAIRIVNAQVMTLKYTNIKLAAETGKIGWIYYVLSDKQAEFSSVDVRSALDRLVYTKNTLALDLLLSDQRVIDALIGSGTALFSLIHSAIELNDPQAVEILLKVPNGQFNINMLTYDAIKSSKFEIVNLMLENDRIKSETYMGFLYDIFGGNKYDLMRLLIRSPRFLEEFQNDIQILIESAAKPYDIFESILAIPGLVFPNDQNRLFSNTLLDPELQNTDAVKKIELLLSDPRAIPSFKEEYFQYGHSLDALEILIDDSRLNSSDYNNIIILLIHKLQAGEPVYDLLTKVLPLSNPQTNPKLLEKTILSRSPDVLDLILQDPRVDYTNLENIFIMIYGHSANLSPEHIKRIVTNPILLDHIDFDKLLTLASKAGNTPMINLALANRKGSKNIGESFVGIVKNSSTDAIKKVLTDKNNTFTGFEGHILVEAIKRNNLDIINLILQDVRFPVSSKNQAALKTAAISAPNDVVQLILKEKGVDVSVDNYEPFRLAAIRDKVTVFMSLFEQIKDDKEAIKKVAEIAYSTGRIQAIKELTDQRDLRSIVGDDAYRNYVFRAKQ